jgi:sugar phosphate isomerase/epimerase
MTIGYGTYGMPEVAVWEALPRLARMGYEAVEICVANRWPTAPEKLSSSDRERLRALLQELGLDLPALMVFVNLLAAPGMDLDEQERLFRDACALTRDLSPHPEEDRAPVIASTLGHCALEWEEALPLVRDRAVWFAGLAAEEGCRLALEPHVGGLLDRPERVTALMEEVRSPSLGINFDISHFAVAGYPRAETIRALAPYALHTHVKDGRMVDGKVQFLLPGEGNFDYVAYFREMAAAGWTGCVTAEVSAQIFNRPGYDPWPAAQFCLDTLRRAREAALGTD